MPSLREVDGAPALVELVGRGRLGELVVGRPGRPQLSLRLLHRGLQPGRVGRQLYDAEGTQTLIDQCGTTGGDVSRSITWSNGSMFICGQLGAALPGTTFKGTQDGFVTRYDL